MLRVVIEGPWKVFFLYDNSLMRAVRERNMRLLFATFYATVLLFNDCPFFLIPIHSLFIISDILTLLLLRILLLILPRHGTPPLLPEDDVKNARVQKHAPGQRAKHDQQLGITVRGRQRQREGAPARAAELKCRLHDRFHALWRLGVRVLVPGRVRKGLAESFEYVDGDLGQDVDVIGDPAAVAGGAVSRVRVAGRAAVDEFLDTGCVGHGGCFDDEADGHAGDGREGDVVAAE